MPAARIFAPFTAGQVEALNAFARVARVRHESPRSGRLCTCEPVATPAGWRCACGWRCYWAWGFMAGEIQQHAAEVKLRAERKAGELLAGMEKHRGGRKTGNTMSPVSTLADVGVEKEQSSRWQRIAAVPEPTFNREPRRTLRRSE